MRVLSAFLLLFIFFQSGCALVTKHREIQTLSELSDAQTDITQFVKRQEEGFALLQDDARNDRLEKGLDKSAAMARYGEPVSCEPKQGKTYSESCLFRKPTQYFNTDKVYLYFDDERHLAGWKIQPADCPAGEQ